MPLVLRQGRDDTGHPLLVASHRLHVPIVSFLLEQALSTRQRGTVHPYTGDNMTVADLKGAGAWAARQRKPSRAPLTTLTRALFRAR